MSRKKKEKQNSKLQKNSQSSKTNRSKKELREARTAQNSINYQMMLKNGICVLPENRYSASMSFKDINYYLATEENQQHIFGEYMQLLNALGTEEGIQLTIHNHKMDMDDFEEHVLLKYEDDGLNNYRVEINKHLKDQMIAGNNKMISDKLFTYTIKENNYPDALKNLRRISNEFNNRFRDLGCDTANMDGWNRLNLLHSIIHPEKKFIFNYNSVISGFSTKDAIAPDYFDFESNVSYFTANDRYYQVLYLKDWSTELGDTLIQELSRLDINLTMSLHMRIIPKGVDVRLVKSQLAKMEGQIYDEESSANSHNLRSVFIPRDLRESHEEGEYLLETLQKHNQRLFECQFLIMINEPTKQDMDEARKSIDTCCKSLSCEMGVLSFRQEEGFNAILPIGKPVEELVRTLPSSVCSVMIPFTSQELMNLENSIFYGTNSITGNLIMGNRKMLENSSGWIYGKPGFGKSFITKLELTWLRLSTKKDEIIIIDPQGEYNYLTKALGGSVIDIDLKKYIHLNPFEADITSLDYQKDKVEFAQVLMTDIMGTDKLTPEQRALIEISVRNVYYQYTAAMHGNKGNDKSEKIIKPSLDAFRNELAKHDELAAKDMVLALAMYIEGATYDIFSGNTNVDLNNRMTCFNIVNLPDTIRSLAMKVILEKIKTTVYENHKSGIRTWIYIDEIYMLLKDEYSENFLFEFFKWARKFGGVPTGITQNVEDLLSSPKTRTMLGNSEFLLMLAQSKSDCDELSLLLGLSPEQSSRLINAKKGEGLIKFGKIIIPFVNNFPKDTQLFNLFNTDFADLERQHT